MIDLRPKVLDYVKAYGPSLPVQVSKAINSNILFSSAVLSELVANGDVFMSHSKIGGSSLYYTKGQEAKLQRLRDYLGEMPKKTFDFLKEKILIDDKKAEPYQRVALRQLRDFAVPLIVKYDGKEFMFWKWYLAADDIVNELIKKDLNIKPEIKEETKPEEKKEEQTQILERQEIIQQEKPDSREEIKQKIPWPKLQRPKKIKEPSSSSTEMVLSYFKKNNISIASIEPIKRNREMAYIVDLPSPIGSLRYLVYFKGKKKIVEDDLILAHHKGQQHKLPVLFLSTGEPTKSAEDYIKKDLNGLLMFKKI